jgi:hypothetical protein
MRRYIVTRTVTIKTEWEAEDPKDAYETHCANEWDAHDINEEEVEIWDVTDPKNHVKVKTQEWGI